MPLCLSAGLLATTLAAESFTLAWTHSIEKIRWEEDWRIENGRLAPVEARIRGTGAGMEMPDGAVLQDGVWRYAPRHPPLTHLLLRHSPYVAAHTLCAGGACRPLPDWLPGLPQDAVVELAPCANGGRK